jgi:tetratricopeptide (TPR) repeat protein
MVVRRAIPIMLAALAVQPAAAQSGSGVFSASQAASSSISAPQRAESIAPARPLVIAVDRLVLSPAERRRLRRAVENEDWPTAQRLLIEALEDRPEPGHLLKALGAASFQNRHYLEAAMAYKRAERLIGLDETSRFTMATAYIALGREHWARPELERLAEEYPDNALYPHWLARVYYAYQWFDQAILQLNKALELAPRFAPAHDRMGLCLEGLGRTDEALEAYRRAIRLERSLGQRSPWTLYHLGSLLHDLGELAKAESVLEEALDVDSELADAHYELGLVLSKQQKGDRAVRALQQAVELDPANPQPHYALAQVYRKLKDKEKALEEVRLFRELAGK